MLAPMSRGSNLNRVINVPGSSMLKSPLLTPPDQKGRIAGPATPKNGAVTPIAPIKMNY